ncbi:YtxH domain-containing protein, partial [Streptococcus pyogenes]
VNKAHDLKDQAVDRFEDVKGQFESGELTIEDLIQSGKEKVQDLTDQIKDKLAEVKSAEEETTIIDIPEEDVIVQEDIEIDL